MLSINSLSQCARQKVKTRIWNVNALWPLKFWWGLTIATTHHLQISNLIQACRGRKNLGEAKAACTITLEGKSHNFYSKSPLKNFYLGSNAPGATLQLCTLCSCY